MALATTAVGYDIAAEGHPVRGSAPSTGTLQWRRPATLFSNTLKDSALTFATLGVYSFWAKTNVRRGLWSGIAIDGRPLRYTGTARELWMPALIIAIAVAVIVFLGFGLKWLFGPLPRPSLATLRSPWRYSLSLPLILLLALGAWRVRDFLLKRTAHGDAVGGLPEATRIPYVLHHFAATLAMGLTAGWALPWRAVRLHQLLMKDATFAGMAVTIHGSARTLYRWFWLPWIGGLLAYLGAVVMLGVLHGPKIVEASQRLKPPTFTTLEWLSVGSIVVAGILVFQLFAAAYQCEQWRQLAAMTQLDGRALQLDIPTIGYTRIAMFTAVLRVASLGLLGSLAHIIKTDYLMRHLQLEPARQRT